MALVIGGLCFGLQISHRHLWSSWLVSCPQLSRSFSCWIIYPLNRLGFLGCNIPNPWDPPYVLHMWCFVSCCSIHVLVCSMPLQICDFLLSCCFCQNQGGRCPLVECVWYQWSKQSFGFSLTIIVTKHHSNSHSHNAIFYTQTQQMNTPTLLLLCYINQSWAARGPWWYLPQLDLLLGQTLTLFVHNDNSMASAMVSILQGSVIFKCPDNHIWDKGLIPVIFKDKDSMTVRNGDSIKTCC